MLPQALTHAEVLAAGSMAAADFERLVRGFLRNLA
jgi:purine nucleoside phosphorylase